MPIMKIDVEKLLLTDLTEVKLVNSKGQEFMAVVRCKDCIHYYADPWGYGNCVFEGGVIDSHCICVFCPL